MAEEWGLPDLADITNTGSEWLLNLLDHKSETMRTMILMTLWRIWHVRNEVVHHKPAPTIESSKRFLCSYLESLISIKSAPNADVVKGKTIVSAHYSDKKEKQISPTADPLKKWCKPQPGTIKLNVDGSFNATLRNGGCGIVLRDDRGAIIFSACKHLDRCADPLEAELSACREGILKVQQADARPCIIEMDSAEAVTMIQEKRLNRSHVTFIVEEIKRLLQVRPSMELVAISRDLNSVSHLLANIGRSQIRSMFWRGSGPENVVALCHEDADD
jgi:ribonuclease HI